MVSIPIPYTILKMNNEKVPLKNYGTKEMSNVPFVNHPKYVLQILSMVTA